jgi:hypothetical protein
MQKIWPVALSTQPAVVFCIRNGPFINLAAIVTHANKRECFHMATHGYLTHAEAVRKLLGRPATQPVARPNPIPNVKTLQDALVEVLRRTDGGRILDGLNCFFEAQVLVLDGMECAIEACVERADFVLWADVEHADRALLCSTHMRQLRSIAPARVRVLNYFHRLRNCETILKTGV